MKDALTITNLHVRIVDGKDILHGVSLTVKKDEIHAIMGPNGGGKSTLAQVLMGHPGYEITKGSIALNGKDITALPPDERAKLGLFLGFQYPVEVAGVNFGNYLRMAINEQKKSGEKKLSPIAFRNQLDVEAKTLGFADELAKRSLNEGFSGGEKKKAEILQLALLKPEFAVLDEPDSGLDVDALQHIAKGINQLDHKMGLILITHYQRILKHIKPDFVHIIIKGKIAKSGDATLAEEIEKSGYAKFK
jgi:Fe-S cluster assembly ATP-binding protein